MKRLLVVAACTALACSLPGSAWAQETMTVQGVVSSVSADSVTVKVMDKDMTFSVDPKTDVIARGGSTASRSARAEGKAGTPFSELIKAGQSVEVHYVEDGMRASTIRVISKVGMPKASRPSAQRASGTVSAVTGDSLTVKGTSGEWTFTVDEKTKVIARGGTTESRAAAAAGATTHITDFVAVGDSVNVTYHEMAGAKHASEVRVTAKAKG